MQTQTLQHQQGTSTGTRCGLLKVCCPDKLMHRVLATHTLKRPSVRGHGTEAEVRRRQSAYNNKKPLRFDRTQEPAALNSKC